MEKNFGEHPHGDSGQIIGLSAFLVIWGADSFFLRWTTFPAADIPPALRLGAAAILFTLAVYLTGVSHFIVRADTRAQRVVSEGVFGAVRHPLYLGTLLTFLALAVSTLSLAALAAWIGLFLFYDAIAGYEEKFMEARFGDAYRTYKKRTGKWLPRLHTGSAA